MTRRRLAYQGLGPIRRATAEAAIRSGDPKEITYALLRLSLHGPDWDLAEEQALAHIHHPDVWVRRNAATALGHTARTSGQLDLDRAMPALLSLLADAETYGAADDALDDVEHYLGVNRGGWMGIPEVRAIKYGRSYDVLEVEMADGDVYRYYDVDPFDYRDLWTAPRPPGTPPDLLRWLSGYRRRKLRAPRLTRPSAVALARTG